MTPEEKHYYEKQSGPTKPNPIMRPTLPSVEVKSESWTTGSMRDARHQLQIHRTYHKRYDDLQYRLHFPSERLLADAIAEIARLNAELSEVHRKNNVAALSDALSETTENLKGIS